MEKWQNTWAYNKYWTMAHSQQAYNQIRLLAKDNDWTPEKEQTFQQLLLDTSKIAPTKETLTNAYQHVWGYFKKYCTPNERAKYQQYLKELAPENDYLGPFLKKMTYKYQIKYLIESRIIREMR